MDNDQHITDLEFRLDQYHEWLTDAIASRDRLALDAAWGVHSGLFALASIALLYSIGEKFTELDHWIEYVGLGIVVTFVQALVMGWSNDLRMKEVEKLTKLPSRRANLD